MTLKQSANDETSQIATVLLDLTLDPRDNSDSKLQQNSLFDPVNRIEANDHVTGELLPSIGRSLKAKLLEATGEDIHDLKELISARLTEGNGETLFEIGVEDDGNSMMFTEEEYQKVLLTMARVVSDLNADYAVVEKRVRDAGLKKQQDIVANLMIRKRISAVEDLLEIRIAVVGNVSTLLGVLTKGILDDGRGKARVNLFRHKHEIESGRTSSVGGEILGYDSKSQPITHPEGSGRKLTWEEICSRASKVLSFVDLAGHEKYLKTTVFGMTGSAPDFVMLMVGANAGIVGMTKEHLGIALSLGIPVLVVVTKIDRCPPKVLEQSIKDLTNILKSKSCRKIPLFVENNTDVIMTAQNFVSERLCPIFQISNVTGQGLDLLKNFLNILPSHTNYENDKPFHYEINEIYSVPFVGTVVSGTIMSGVIHVGDRVLIGPDSTGTFTPTTIKGIHRKRVAVPAARAGQSVTFALKNIRRAAIRKGMVLLPYEKDKPLPKCSRRFEAEILVLYHSTTIKEKYQAMVHCGPVRQTASIVHMEKKVLRTGDRALVEFEFVKYPEYLLLGSRLIFREGRTKGVGKVTKLLT
ncbi:P-loop containing nucleoside triphosphate hydrolase protein [Dichotomocladium elegans]|nr:P-loop containing nucleoside triphosphate hydrolase protein [Dichotomocladium elegans]